MTLEKVEQHLVELESTLYHLKLDVEQLKKEQQQPEPPRLERWKPEKTGTWYWLNSQLQPQEDRWQSDSSSAKVHFNNFNCFQTEKEAEKEALRTRARRKLEWMARELNNNNISATIWYIIVHDAEISRWRVCVQHDVDSFSAFGAFVFACPHNAEYALSQMTSEELEALL